MISFPFQLTKYLVKYNEKKTNKQEKNQTKIITKIESKKPTAVTTKQTKTKTNKKICTQRYTRVGFSLSNMFRKKYCLAISHMIFSRKAYIL